MSAAEDVIQVINLYGFIIDDSQWHRLDELYVNDGIFIQATGESHEGIDAIGAFLSSFPRPRVHYTTNSVISFDLDGESASAISKLLVILENGDLVIGQYDDDLVRIAAGWRFKRRKCSISSVV